MSKVTELLASVKIELVWAVAPRFVRRIAGDEHSVQGVDTGGEQVDEGKLGTFISGFPSERLATARKPARPMLQG
jgi:hypothetical protein